jgi:hypothetical protein
VRVSADRWVDPAAFAELRDAATRAVRAQLASVPTDGWAGFATVRARIPALAGDDALRAALDAARGGALEASPSGWRTPGHRAHAGDSGVALALQRRLAAAGLAPDTLESSRASCVPSCASSAPSASTSCASRSSCASRPTCSSTRPRSRRCARRVVAFLRAHGQIDPAAYKSSPVRAASTPSR